MRSVLRSEAVSGARTCWPSIVPSGPYPSMTRASSRTDVSLISRRKRDGSGQSATRSMVSDGRGRTPGGTVSRAARGEETQWNRGGSSPISRYSSEMAASAAGRSAGIVWSRRPSHSVRMAAASRCARALTG
jgi:hypothetical protein